VLDRGKWPTTKPSHFFPVCRSHPAVSTFAVRPPCPPFFGIFLGRPVAAPLVSWCPLPPQGTFLPLRLTVLVSVLLLPPRKSPALHGRHSPLIIVVFFLSSFWKAVPPLPQTEGLVPWAFFFRFFSPDSCPAGSCQWGFSFLRCMKASFPLPPSYSIHGSFFCGASTMPHLVVGKSAPFFFPSRDCFHLLLPLVSLGNFFPSLPLFPSCGTVVFFSLVYRSPQFRPSCPLMGLFFFQRLPISLLTFSPSAAMALRERVFPPFQPSPSFFPSSSYALFTIGCPPWGRPTFFSFPTKRGNSLPPP